MSLRLGLKVRARADPIVLAIGRATQVKVRREVSSDASVSRP